MSHLGHRSIYKFKFFWRQTPTPQFFWPTLSDNLQRHCLKTAHHASQIYRFEIRFDTLTHFRGWGHDINSDWAQYNCWLVLPESCYGTTGAPSVQLVWRLPKSMLVLNSVLYRLSVGDFVLSFARCALFKNVVISTKHSLNVSLLFREIPNVNWQIKL